MSDWIDAAANEISQEAYSYPGAVDGIMRPSAARQIIEKHAPGWISVEERLPEGWVPVLAWSSLEGSPYSAYYAILVTGERYWGAGEFSAKPTHWQPLPEPPKGKS